MKKNNKFKIIRKPLKSKCYCCDGKGWVRDHEYPSITCKTCNGTGKYTENYYYFIVGKYCYDGDTLK